MVQLSMTYPCRWRRREDKAEPIYHLVIMWEAAAFLVLLRMGALLDKARLIGKLVN